LSDYIDHVAVDRRVLSLAGELEQASSKTTETCP